MSKGFSLKRVLSAVAIATPILGGLVAVKLWPEDNQASAPSSVRADRSGQGFSILSAGSGAQADTPAGQFSEAASAPESSGSLMPERQNQTRYLYDLFKDDYIVQGGQPKTAGDKMGLLAQMWYSMDKDIRNASRAGLTSGQFADLMRTHAAEAFRLDHEAIRANPNDRQANTHRYMLLEMNHKWAGMMDDGTFNSDYAEQRLGISYQQVITDKHNYKEAGVMAKPQSP